MPVLHEYNPGYHKSGYYVKVNWSAPHPYPLQTPYITEQIYRELGFKPEDEIPNELTSRLFNAGLHWTEGNGPSDPEKQTNLDSISDTDLPNVDPEQLEKVYNLLANEEFSLDGRTVDNGSLSELKSELEELRDVGNKNKNSTIPSRPEPLISDLCNKNLTQEQATDIRESARNQGFFDRSIYQFTRKHPITSRGFGVNEYGNPAYRFQTGPVEWKLADCRARNLDFEWAVTIDPGTEREYGLRVSQTRLVRVIFDGQKLTKQQAVDLITIIPCLVWIFDVLSEYSLSDGWHGQEIRDDLPSPHHTWLTDQIDASTATKAGHTDTAPNKGIVIDLPDRNFARIRSQGRDIICAPVNSLPDRIELGSEVTFETTQRYGSYYGKNITVVDNPVTNIAQNAEAIITFEETEDDFLIPKPVSELATETAVEIVLDILDSVCLQTAITNELVQRLLLSIESQSEHYDELLQNLLKDTPFDPAIFSDLVGEIHTHHRIPREDLSFRTLPLALCVSFFYRSIDDEKAVLKADMQGDSTVFYERDDECLIVGNRLVWKAFNTEPTEAPRSIRDAITVTNRNRKLVVPVNKAITALCERQFHLNCPSGDTLTSEILKHGLHETGAAVIYLSLENTQSV